MSTKKFVHLDPVGNPWGIVSTENLWANVYAIKFNRPEKSIGSKTWYDLFYQAKTASIEFGASSIECRIRLEYEPALFRSILQDLGFEKKAGRIEYQCEIQYLPNEDGSPLTWQTAKELQWNLNDITNFTKEVVYGALDVDPDEKVEDFIQDWLFHHEFTSGSECIAIGFYDKHPIAMTVAQISKDSGWSRISYMGVIPNFRGKGFGKWVHRHGFVMMKQQGGKLYHGGTHIQNLPMRKLFEASGCKVFCEMEEWSCRP